MEYALTEDCNQNTIVMFCAVKPPTTASAAKAVPNISPAGCLIGCRRFFDGMESDNAIMDAVPISAGGRATEEVPPTGGKK